MWRRAWRDTAKAHWALWLVDTLLALVVATVAAVALIATDVDNSYVEVGVPPGITLSMIISFAALVFTLNLYRAPFRQRDEARQLLQTPEFPDMAIEALQPPLQMRPPIKSDDIEKIGWMFFIGNVRITNQSQTEKVSLGLTLHIRLASNPSGQRELVLPEDEVGGVVKPEGQFQHWLRCPINIEPAQSVTGGLGFLVWRFIEVQLGGDLGAVIDRPDGYQMDSYLEVEDHVTGQRIKMKLPGHYPPEQDHHTSEPAP